jgi:hypothetical protein
MPGSPHFDAGRRKKPTDRELLERAHRLLVKLGASDTLLEEIEEALNA